MNRIPANMVARVSPTPWVCSVPAYLPTKACCVSSLPVSLGDQCLQYMPGIMYMIHGFVVLCHG